MFLGDDDGDDDNAVAVVAVAVVGVGADVAGDQQDQMICCWS